LKKKAAPPLPSLEKFSSGIGGRITRTKRFSVSKKGAQKSAKDKIKKGQTRQEANPETSYEVLKRKDA
jgi:hypothetical protein